MLLLLVASASGFAARTALLFDCDGVLVETEELHRTAYNQAFEAFGLRIGGEPVHWSASYYDRLQNTVGGGKPKMRYHFTQEVGAWPVVLGGARPQPANDEQGEALIDDLQDYKTECYKKLVDTAHPRPGILEVMDDAIATPGLAVGICSASTRGGFEKVVDAVVGPIRLAKLDVIIAGDDVRAKKPAPDIYNLASQKLGVDPQNCVVVEDSLVGLRAARAAGMHCIITYTSSTAAEDFYGEGAAAKLVDFSRTSRVLPSIFSHDFSGAALTVVALRAMCTN
ncbi:hypothetical protein CTAYLR_009597 [Chrysophaeum taylorii]|uniref:Uncharacterized protein n=1 Tax=Chrysophaeum taylorii TaxID=2483200 RepID=A0AAD7UJA5_9STRA|nr:hypothetical protein CTAYLR_009597 [Chrysophaeum taylorii]